MCVLVLLYKKNPSLLIVWCMYKNKQKKACWHLDVLCYGTPHPPKKKKKKTERKSQWKAKINNERRCQEKLWPMKKEEVFYKGKLNFDSRQPNSTLLGLTKHQPLHQIHKQLEMAHPSHALLLLLQQSSNKKRKCQHSTVEWGKQNNWTFKLIS